MDDRYRTIRSLRSLPPTPLREILTSLCASMTSPPAADLSRLWPAMALIVVPFLGLIALEAYQVLDRRAYGPPPRFAVIDSEMISLTSILAI